MELDLPESRMPIGFNQDDFKFSKLYKCVHKEGRTTMYDVVCAMYAHPPTNSEGGTMVLQDYFEQVLNWPKHKIKSFFGKIDQGFLKGNLNEQELDITFTYKVMKEACHKIYEELSDKCKIHIDHLKTLRNKISHKYGCEGLKLESEIDDLTIVLRKIYEGVGSVLEVDFSDNIASMEKRLSDICGAQVHQKSINSYEEDVQSFKKDSIHKLISLGRKELKDEYYKLRICNPCTWMLDEEMKKSSVNKFHIDKIMTPLKIKDSRETIEMTNLLTETTDINGEQKLPTALLLYGLAGSGKTTLCHYLLHEWYSEYKDSTMNKFDLVFFVSVRTVRSRSLKEYLREQLIFRTTQDFKEDSIIPLLKELDILFIIDGFDEANDVSGDLVEEIFAKFGDHRIILTTRPEFQRDTALMSQRYHVDYHMIEICGFDDQRIEEFTKDVFKAVEKNIQKCQEQTSCFLKYIRGPGKVLGNHLRLPLTLALLIYLWRDDPKILNQVTTSTCLYFELFKLCQRKMLERLKPKRSQDSRLIEGLLLFLGEQAWCMLQKGNIGISDDIKDKIEKKCISEGIDETQFMSAFLMCEFNESYDIHVKNFSFLHKTQMEYLAAAFLANVVKKNKDFNYIKEVVNDWRRYHEVIIFLTGHLAKERIIRDYILYLFELINKAEVERLDFNFWWRIYIESFQESRFGNLIAQEKLPIEDWELNDRHLVSGLKLLMHTKVKLRSLKIETASSVEPFTIPDFLDTMKEMRVKLKHRYDKHNPILVQMHFWRHNEYSFDKSSDEFLRTLYPWGHLENFTGSVGEQEEGKEVLSYCFNLKSIRVRVMTPGALKSLSNSLFKIHKTVRQLRVTLALPMDCEPTSLAALSFKGKLEITMQSIGDENKEWFVEVIRQVSGSQGCQHIYLQRSEVSFSGILWLLKNIRAIFQGKLSIETINEPDMEEKAKLGIQMRKAHIEINWL